MTKIDSCYLLSQGEKYGLYLPVCSKVIQPKYSEISYSSGNCAIVRENDKYGLLDIETGEIVIEPCYLEMRYFGEGTILVSKRPGCYGIIANNGDTIVPADGTYRVNPNEGFGDALVPICEDNNWGYIINPLIYSEWNSDVTKRAASLGLELNGQDCSCGDFLGLSYNVLLRYMEWTGNRGTLTDGNIPESCEGLQQLLNVSNLQEAEPISRQQAAFVLAQMAKQCGNVTEYYTNYCGDAAEVDTQYAPAVAYISSLGVFDIQDNLFMPTQILDGREAVSVMALFLEELLDTESSFRWSVDGEMVKINDLATSTISLEAPSSLSACWW